MTVPKPIGASEWSQRASRPDKEPMFINSGDPRIAEAVRRTFADNEEREHRVLCRWARRLLRMKVAVPPAAVREIIDKAAGLVESGNPRSFAAAAGLVLEVLRHNFELVRLTIKLARTTGTMDGLLKSWEEAERRASERSE